ncbi:MAG: hypothetical protein FWE23_08215 [Chitinivibrionia bacterium]|nr:hypothetical protein [Chitinivibrionia bacterium]
MSIKKIIILAAIFSASVWAQSINWNALQISISTEAQLREFATQVNNGNDFRNQTITLENDIELVGGNWVPIGGFFYDYYNGFNGIFNGNNKIIKGLTIDTIISAQTMFAFGLFGFVAEYGIIKNLGVVDFNITLNDDGDEGEGGVGGVVGMTVGRVENSYAVGIIKIIGYVYGDFGGLVGFLGRGTVVNSYADVNIIGSHSVGGLVGGSEYGVIENSYAVGSVTGNYGAGKLIGSGWLVNILSSYALEGEYELFPSNSEGTICENSRLLTEAELRQQSTFIGWDFTNIWQIDSEINNGFPFLRGFAPPTSISRNSTTRRAVNTASFAGIRNGQIHLNLTAGNYTAQLYNLQGRLISSVNITAINGVNAIGLRTDNLARGVFVLNVKQNGTSMLRQRISVNR